MPTTTNFGWTIPADTDLVKDGALAMRTLANGIDTSLAQLKGGTTGQILSKTSNTDMAFTWINNDQGDLTAITAGTGITVTSGTGPIPTVALTVPVVESSGGTNQTTYATGDLLYASAANTLSKRSIGTNGQVLTVSGGVPTWATASSGGFTLIDTRTPSAAGSLTFSNISSSYKHLLLVWNGMNSGGNDAQYGFTFNNDTGSNYDFTQGVSNTWSQAYLTWGSQNTDTGAMKGWMWIYDYASTSYWKSYTFNYAGLDSNSQWRRADGGAGVYRSTSAISRIDAIFLSGGGTINTRSGGNLKLYGVS